MIWKTKKLLSIHSSQPGYMVLTQNYTRNILVTHNPYTIDPQGLWQQVQILILMVYKKKQNKIKQTTTK